MKVILLILVAGLIISCDNGSSTASDADIPGAGDTITTTYTYGTPSTNSARGTQGSSGLNVVWKLIDPGVKDVGKLVMTYASHYPLARGEFSDACPEYLVSGICSSYNWITEEMLSTFEGLIQGSAQSGETAAWGNDIESFLTWCDEKEVGVSNVISGWNNWMGDVTGLSRSQQTESFNDFTDFVGSMVTQGEKIGDVMFNDFNHFVHTANNMALTTSGSLQRSSSDVLHFHDWITAIDGLGETATSFFNNLADRNIDMSVIKSHYHSTKRDDGFSTSSFVASLYNAAHTMERSSVSAGIAVLNETMPIMDCNDASYGADTKTHMLNSIDPNIINYTAPSSAAFADHFINNTAATYTYINTIKFNLGGHYKAQYAPAVANENVSQGNYINTFYFEFDANNSTLAGVGEDCSDAHAHVDDYNSGQNTASDPVNVNASVSLSITSLVWDYMMAHYQTFYYTLTGASGIQSVN